MEMKNKKELIRVVRTEAADDNATHEFSLDFTGKKSGRGAYICPTQDCLEKARKQKGLERSFKQTVPAEVYQQMEEELKHYGS